MNLLEVKELKKYYKNIKAVDGIDFQVKEGEILGLLGPNGAGKSTTISMISTLLKPDGGDIIYNGQSIVKNPKAIQPHLGYVPQEIALYPTLSGLDNLKFWGKTYGLKGKLLKDRIEKISKVIGIDERLKDRVDNYSGGMQRRINIGVALLHNPDFIIMDEPTVGIDPQSRKYILDTVKQLNRQGMTVIYTSHYMEEVEYLCNNICIMDKGKIIAKGTKEELMNQVEDEQKAKVSFDKITEQVIQKIKELNYVLEVKVKEDNLEIVYKSNNEIFKDIIKKSEEVGRSIMSFDIYKPNLETVFLNLTGKALRD